MNFLWSPVVASLRDNACLVRRHHETAAGVRHPGRHTPKAKLLQAAYLLLGHAVANRWVLIGCGALVEGLEEHLAVHRRIGYTVVHLFALLLEACASIAS